MICDGGGCRISPGTCPASSCSPPTSHHRSTAPQEIVLPDKSVCARIVGGAIYTTQKNQKISIPLPMTVGASPPGAAVLPTCDGIVPPLASPMYERLSALLHVRPLYKYARAARAARYALFMPPLLSRVATCTTSRPLCGAACAPVGPILPPAPAFLPFVAPERGPAPCFEAPSACRIDTCFPDVRIAPSPAHLSSVR